MLKVDHPNKKFMAKFERHEPLIQDHTATICAKSCYRKYFYRFVLGRTIRQSKYQVVFDFGSAYHKFREELEIHYKETGSQEKAFSKALVKVIDFDSPVDPGFKFAYLTRERLIKTCKEAYNLWSIEKRLGRIEVIDVEQPFNIAIEYDNGNIFIGGRFDQIVKWNGKIWIRDFKTTSKEERYYGSQLDPNDQAIRYIYGAGKLHGTKIEGTIFDVVYNTKTIGPKFFVKLVSKTTYQLAQWEKEQIFLNKQLEICRELDIWPMQEHNCSFCDFADVCRSPSEESMISKLEQNYILKPWDHTKVDQEVEG